MKRILPLLLVFILIFSVPAYADGSDGGVSISFDKCEPGEEYALFVVTPGTNRIKADTILFVDQITADSSGRISLFFLSPNWTDGTVFLSGNFTDGASSPRRIGTPSSVTEKPLQMPGMLTEIEAEAFAGGTFTHVYLGENVTTIGSKAFANCQELLYIYIPAATTSIAGDAFDGSGNVVIACRAGSAAYDYAVAKGINYKIVE